MYNLMLSKMNKNELGIIIGAPFLCGDAILSRLERILQNC